MKRVYVLVKGIHTRLVFFSFTRKVVFPFYGVPETTQKWNTRKGTLVTRTYAELFRNQSATLTLAPARRRAASISKLSRLFRDFFNLRVRFLSVSF